MSYFIHVTNVNYSRRLCENKSNLNTKQTKVGNRYYIMSFKLYYIVRTPYYPNDFSGNFL